MTISAVFSLMHLLNLFSIRILFIRAARWCSGYHCCLTARRFEVRISTLAFLGRVCMFSLCPVHVWVFVHDQSKLTVGVSGSKCLSVCLSVCLSLSVSPVVGWRPIQGAPCLSPLG